MIKITKIFRFMRSKAEVFYTKILRIFCGFIIDLLKHSPSIPLTTHWRPKGEDLLKSLVFEHIGDFKMAGALMKWISWILLSSAFEISLSNLIFLNSFNFKNYLILILFFFKTFDLAVSLKSIYKIFYL